MDGGGKKRDLRNTRTFKREIQQVLGLHYENMGNGGGDGSLGRTLALRLRTAFHLFIYLIRCFLCNRVSSETVFFKRWKGAVLKSADIPTNF